MHGLILALALLAAQESAPFPADLESRAVLATVRIDNPAASQASGVVIARRGPFAYVLTARHVVAGSDTVTVQLFTAGSYPRPAATYLKVPVLAKDAVRDVAVLRVPTELAVDPVPLCPPGRLPKSAAFPALTTGCAGGMPPTKEVTRVLAAERIRRPGQTGTLAWQTNSAPAKGRSGGGLIDTRGYLVGVASGRDTGKGYYCHTQEIHRFLTDNVLNFLYEGAEPPARPVP